jgi:hypothetical protein
VYTRFNLNISQRYGDIHGGRLLSARWSPPEYIAGNIFSKFRVVSWNDIDSFFVRPLGIYMSIVVVNNNINNNLARKLSREISTSPGGGVSRRWRPGADGHKHFDYIAVMIALYI